MEGGTVQSITIPAPVMGWNTKASPLGLPLEYAVELKNWVPDGDKLVLRKGARLHAHTVESGTVSSFSLQMIAQHIRDDGTEYMIALEREKASPQFFNCTSSGAATSLGAGGVGSGRLGCYTLNFRDRIYLKKPNNTDDVYYWQGGAGALTAPAFVGPGGDDKNLGAMGSYRRRLYFAQLDAPIIWYGGLDQVTDPPALTSEDLGSFLKRGGYFWFLGSISQAGDSVQNLFVAITNMGEILIYQGDYPASTTWSLIGQYYIAPPASRYSFFYWGSDLIIITLEGVVALSAVINAGARGQFLYLTDRVNNKFKEFIDYTITFPAGDFSMYINGIHYPKENLLLINFPVSAEEGEVGTQFVMNTQTGAWTRFYGWYSSSFCLYQNNLYFSTFKGQTHRAFYYSSTTNNIDDFPTGSGGSVTASPIGSLIRHSFSYLGDTANYKTVLQVRPIITLTNGIVARVGIDGDFDNTAVSSDAEFSDTTDTASKLYKNIIQAQASGKALSVRYDKVTPSGTAEIHATEIFYETGGPFA